MMKRVLTMMLALAFYGAGVTASASKIVKEFSGSGMATTAEFEVKAPWILEWRVNSDYQESLAIEISLVDAKTGFHAGRIKQTNGRILRDERSDNGIRLFNKGGKYRFRISSSFARWNLKIEELTRAEAELYKPRQD